MERQVSPRTGTWHRCARGRANAMGSRERAASSAQGRNPADGACPGPHGAQ